MIINSQILCSDTDPAFYSVFIQRINIQVQFHHRFLCDIIRIGFIVHHLHCG